MKIRNGFVSNSSSSSFIIPVDDNLTEQELYARILEIYPTEDYITNDIFDINITPRELCNIILRDIEYYRNEKKGNHRKALKNDMENHVMTKYGLYDILYNETSLEQKFDKYDKIREVVGKKAKTDLVMMEKDNKGKTLVRIEYGDNNNNIHAFLEHSGIIEKLFPGTLRVSYH